MSRPDRYRLNDGTVVPGTTTITGRFKDSGGLMHWAFKQGKEGKQRLYEERDKAAAAGTLAHDLIEAHVSGVEHAIPPGLDPETEARALKGFAAFRRWFADSRVRILATEVPLVSEEWRFGGTIDALGLWGQQYWLLDWKTSKGVYADHVAQLAAYRHLVEHGHLVKDATYGGAWPTQPIEIAEAHVCRFDKEWGHFAHHQFSLELVDVAWRYFTHIRGAWDAAKTLEKAV